MKKQDGFLRDSNRCNPLVYVMGTLLCLLLAAPNSYARDVSFLWSANPETVDGYRLYYKTGSSGEPYSGTGATEGPSPVATGNVTSFTLRDLSETETYYFVLTAYLGAEESPYSTEIVLPPSPPAAGRTVSFVWTANPETVDGYRLHYKTGSSGQPYNGTGLAEGPSPVDTGNVTSFTLHDLSETETYYFALTAYLGAEESGYTQEIVLTPSFVNSPPAASAGTIAVVEDTPLPGQLSATDPDGDALTYSIVSNAAKGSAVVTNAATGAFTYTPNLNLTGSDSFTFKVNDGTVDSNTATVTVAISSVNDLPAAIDASISVNEDAPMNGQLSGSDPDGDALTYSIVANGTRGSAVVNNTATGAFTYTPNTNETGSDSFTFRVNDGTVNSNIATVAVDIAAVNDPPTASGTSIATDENAAYTGQLSANDPDGDALTYTIVTNGTRGNAVVTDPSTGAFTYTPITNETGSDSFTFRVNDGTVNSNTATVNVAIAVVNDPPTAIGASIATDEDTVYSGQLSANDPDGDALTYSIVTNGTRGSAVVTDPSTGAFTYTPNLNETGSDSFTFMVNDGTVDSAAATVSIAIAVVNDPPAASGDSIATDEDMVFTGQLSASDPDGDALTYSIVTNGTRGIAVVTDPSTGAFTYTPNLNETGSDSFTFIVNDGTVDSAVATVNVAIAAYNDPPVAMDSSVSTDENTVYTGQLSASDPDGDALTYSVVVNGTRGNAVVTDPATGVFTYTPNTNETGGDSFTFIVNDGTMDSSAATVNLTIFDANVVTEVFGDTPGADHPGTLTDTFANSNADINAADDHLNIWSYSSPAPHKIANTIIMKADLAAIPGYATVVEARLYLYQTGANGESQYSNSIHKITGKNPIISQVTGYNAFNGAPWTPVPANTTNNDVPLGLADVAAEEDANFLSAQDGYNSWLITNMVQEWVNTPSTNFGLLIKGEATAIQTGRTFASSENQNVAIRPNLVVWYRLIPPAPQLILIEEIK